MIRINRRNFIQLTGAAATVPILGRQALAADDSKLKIGFIYVGPINDGGWNTAHEHGRQQMMAKLGDKVTSSYIENVPENADAATALRNLVNQGCKLVFATSFGFMDSTMKVAKQFPNVKFEMCTGYKHAPNVANYNIRFHEARSVIGTIAGMLSKKGVGGYLATFPVPEVVSGIDSFTLAAQRVNPDFKTKIIWINTWFDPAKEADATRALINQGADVMTQHTDSPAAVQVCEQLGIPTFGQGADQSKFAPTMCKTSSEDEWGPYYIARAQAVLDDKWKAEDAYWGMKEGALQMAPITHVPDDVKAAAEKVIAGWKDGSYNCYTGPIKDQSGAVKVAEGKTMSNDEILGLNWLVQGVEGKLG